jgi:hypothetical protein
MCEQYAVGIVQELLSFFEKCERILNVAKIELNLKESKETEVFKLEKMKKSISEANRFVLEVCSKLRLAAVEYQKTKSETSLVDHLKTLNDIVQVVEKTMIQDFPEEQATILLHRNLVKGVMVRSKFLCVKLEDRTWEIPKVQSTSVHQNWIPHITRK